MSIKELSETISKLGTFGIAAVIIAVVSAVPVAITIDARYAKEKALQEQMSETNKRLEEQVMHLQTVNGQLQVLLSVMIPTKQVAQLPALPVNIITQAPVAAPKITEAQQKAIDLQKPKEVVIQSLKNNTIQTDEKLKQTLQAVKQQ
jgi:hypothetical protein